MIRKFLRLSFRQKGLLVQASLLLLLIQAGLSVFSFTSVYHWSKSLLVRPKRRANDFSASDEICWGVTKARKAWFGNEGCLAQAILGECLLIQRGIPAKLCIGVRRQPDGLILAHAWVESNGQVLIGDSAGNVPDEFTNLPNLKNVIG